jgi:hypothetical protein
VRRKVVALVALAVTLAGCGGVEDEAPPAGEGNAPQVDAADPHPTRLIELDDGVHAIGLYSSHDRVGCFDDQFDPGDEPDSFVSFGRGGCIEDRAWHLRISTGGEPGSVDWTLIVGVTRPDVDRVTITSENGAEHQRATEPAPVGDWRVFSYELDEAVRRLEARTAAGELLASVTVPDQIAGPCDWLCEGQGPWARKISPERAEGLAPRRPDPIAAIVAADHRLEALLAGTRFALWPPKDWTDCAGIERGITWILSPDEPRALAGGEWPTVNESGEAITLTSSEPAEEVVVDIDRDRGEVISILPYSSDDAMPWSGSTRADAPLGDSGCRPVP